METTTKPEYQHFVPQFLLRNFSHPYKPAGNKKRGQRKDQNGIYYNELVVNNVDLTADPLIICEKPVKRILGQMNMYQDVAPSSNSNSNSNSNPGNDSTPPSQTQTQKNLEDMLGKLENKAAVVFRKITKAFDKHLESNKANEASEATTNETTGEQGPALVELTRAERDLIRKFLFILKYRGSGFHRRFYHDKPESYSDIDREVLREYMAKRGYARPLDVWYDNIKAIIEVDMDLEGKWMTELPKRMYPDDAIWFWTHTEYYYMYAAPFTY